MLCGSLSLSRPGRISGILLSFLILPACGEESHSHVDYLTNQNYACDPLSSGRLSQVENGLPAGFLRGYQGSQQAIALNRLAGIPDRYLDHLAENFEAGVFQGIKPETYLSPGVAGLTRLRGGSGPYRGLLVAVSVTTAATAAGFALQHEIGHAVESVARLDARAKGIDFDQEVRAMLMEFKGMGSIRSYAKSSEPEAWAEAFANFYCSGASRAFIDDKLSARTKNFLTGVLVPPVWQDPDLPPPPDAGGGGGSGTGSPRPDPDDGQGGDSGDPSGDTICTSGADGRGEGAGCDDAVRSRAVETGIFTAFAPVESRQDAFEIRLATVEAIASIQVCPGTGTVCGKKKPDSRGPVLHRLEPETTRNRRHYYPPFSTDEFRGRDLTFFGLDAAGQTVSRRSVRLVPVGPVDLPAFQLKHADEDGHDH